MLDNWMFAELGHARLRNVNNTCHCSDASSKLVWSIVYSSSKIWRYRGLEHVMPLTIPGTVVDDWPSKQLLIDRQLHSSFCFFSIVLHGTGRSLRKTILPSNMLYVLINIGSNSNFTLITLVHAVAGGAIASLPKTVRPIPTKVINIVLLWIFCAVNICYVCMSTNLLLLIFLSTR